MADASVGDASAAQPTAAPPTAAVDKQRPSGSTRASKLASVNAGLKKLAEGAEPTAAVEPAAPSEPKPAADPEAPKLNDKPAEDPKAEPAKDPEPDPQTARALSQIDKRMAAFRDEQKKAKAELEAERSELQRIRAEHQKGSASIDELRKLAKQNPIAVLEKLGIDSEDDWERVGRGAFPRTKVGKADPKNQATVEQMTERDSIKAEIAELKKTAEELRNEFKTRDERAASQHFIDRYLDDAVKAIPGDRKTLIGNLHAKSPAKARQALLETGARLERENDNETPSHAEVIAEYERMRRAELEEAGVDVESLLRPSQSGSAKTPTRPNTALDITAPTGTRPINGNPTRESKLAAVTAGLKRLSSENTV